MNGQSRKSAADKPSPAFAELKKQLAEAGPNSAVIYLGDNIYEYGLPADSAPDRKEMERRMTTQLEPANGFQGKTIVIPGNHDWAQGIYSKVLAETARTGCVLVSSLNTALSIGPVQDISSLAERAT